MTEHTKTHLEVSSRGPAGSANDKKTSKQGVLSALEILLLGPLAAILVLLAIPSGAGVNTYCIFGPGAPAAHTYVHRFAAVGLVTWIALIAATMMAFSSGRRTLCVLLPLGWFLGIVVLALLVVSQMGPHPCWGS